MILDKNSGLEKDVKNTIIRDYEGEYNITNFYFIVSFNKNHFLKDGSRCIWLGYPHKGELKCTTVVAKGEGRKLEVYILYVVT